MRALLSIVAFSLSLSFLSPSSASSRPRIAAEIENQKFCFTSGDIETYGPVGHPGKFNNNKWGDGTWEMTENGKWVWKFDKVDATFVGVCETDGNKNFTYTGPVPGQDTWVGYFHPCSE